MCINFLRLNAEAQVNGNSNSNSNLGDLLLGFLELYGQKFDYENIGIYVGNGSMEHLPRNELPCGPIDGQPRLICIVESLNPNLNVCMQTYRPSDVKQAFHDAYVTLSMAISSNNRSTTNDCTENSILSQIIHTSNDFIMQRKRAADIYDEHNFSSAKQVKFVISIPNETFHALICDDSMIIELIIINSLCFFVFFCLD